ncbi:restriction endonuclease subunit S [Pectobacterium punjabense]|uniref:restriction endonuclease subunit S n=1 Tax=Pectobacterium punjabense TaxID=2108399 RepID=UPI0024064054|nr:restriction endonuclease subunit S [Pectobacterium punjabense]MDG0797871.1 restriction endonuclease subunit S [Pectobacterium punjabense]
MAKYKAYPEYKDSGVEWLGKIPEHWQLSKLRYMFTFGKGLTITKENLQDEGIPCVNYGEVHSKYGFEVDPQEHPLKCVSETYLKNNTTSLLIKGDVVFADTSEDIEGSGNFTQLISNVTTFAGYHTIIARPLKRNNSRFYAYLLDCKELRAQVRHAVKGVKVFSITQAILRNISIWLPSENEQGKISAFLDHETTKIDDLIEKQQQLIELLKEKRQAVISHAVTKGLNPNVPMKESGVEWLGEVPEHWRLKQIRHLCTFLGGGTPSKSNPDFWAGNIPWVSPKDMKFDYIFDAEDHISESAVKQSSTKIIPVNSVLIVVRGMILSHSVPVAINTNRVTINQDMKALIPNFEISPEYLHLVLKGFKKSLLDLTDNSAHGTKCLKTESFERMQIPLPPLHEQNKIIFDMKELISKIDSLLNRQYEATALLQERRTALISAAVTGKIDVRDWAAPDSSEMANIKESPEVNA